MTAAMEEADWSGFEGRRAASAARGLCRGIAVANYIEVTSGIPRERAELRAYADGTVELVVGTMSSGQGHETSFPQLAGEWLQIPFESVRFIANDADRVTVGGGSHSGRSMRLASIAIGEAVADLLAKGRAVAGHALQAPAEAVIYEAGRFAVPGGGSIDLAGVARAAESLGNLPDDLRGVLEGIGDITNRVGGYPYGSHVCEVEVDPDTGPRAHRRLDRGRRRRARGQSDDPARPGPGGGRAGYRPGPDGGHPL
ncbi:MAG: molybdopterin cofactor-binding domain-containing protein [Rickettsiales bacterium]